MSTEKICRTCQYTTTKPGNHAHYKVGLRNCFHLPTWHFVGGNHTCAKWEAK